MTETFGDRLAAQVEERQSNLVLGLDPDPARLWPEAVRPGGTAPALHLAAAAVSTHCRLAIEAVAPFCAAVKLQLACFERLGAPGRAVLDEVVEICHRHGLLVIADAKRGDIDVSARAYAQALLGETPSPFGTLEGLGADAATVNPLLGAESLEPFLEVARRRGRGLFVLVRTSNPGAADVQELGLRDGGTVSRRLAELVDTLGADGIGRCGLSDVGAVVGATAPERLAELREAMPHAILLLPGVGAQGGQISDLAAAFAPGPAGGLITVSRGIVGVAREGQAAAPAAREAAERLREQSWAVAGRGR